MNTKNNKQKFIYTYACHESEQELCRMELSSLLGVAIDNSPNNKQDKQDGNLGSNFIISEVELENNRSPFITTKMEILWETPSLEGLMEVMSELNIAEIGLADNVTFKVRYLKQGDIKDYDTRRNVERKLGSQIQGIAEMKLPDILFGVLSTAERWYFGRCYETASPWLSHKHKPQNYSTGLSTVVARALVNIAAPQIEGKKVIDPCCGMGNVVIEGLSMGMDIVGRDINPLAIRGARVNLSHFGYGDSLLVELGDLRDITAKYDAAIVDMPYNLCSVMSKEQCQEMLQAVYQFSNLAVIVSSEQLEDDIVQAGWHIKDRCTVAKGAFVRYVWLCCKSQAFDL